MEQYEQDAIARADEMIDADLGAELCAEMMDKINAAVNATYEAFTLAVGIVVQRMDEFVASLSEEARKRLAELIEVDTEPEFEPTPEQAADAETLRDLDDDDMDDND